MRIGANVRASFVFALAAAVAGSAHAALRAQSTDAQHAQPFRAGAHAVLVYASVTDKAGNPVHDLSRANFDVEDNGKRQTLTAFSAEPQPLSVVLMLDRSGTGPRTLNIEREAALGFLHALIPGDRARIGTFAATTTIAPASFTSDHEELVRQLEAQSVEAGPTPLWNAATMAIDVLSHEDNRRVLVIFTDGHDSPNPAAGNADLSAVRARAEGAGVMVYTVGLFFKCAENFESEWSVESGQFSGSFSHAAILAQRGAGGRGGGGRGGGRSGRGRGDERPCTPANGAKPDPGLKDLAIDAGGVYTELHGGEDLAETFGHLADDLHQQYLLAFAPAVLDGKDHVLKVKVQGRSDLVIRSRAHYAAVADTVNK